MWTRTAPHIPQVVCLRWLARLTDRRTLRPHGIEPDEDPTPQPATVTSREGLSRTNRERQIERAGRLHVVVRASLAMNDRRALLPHTNGRPRFAPELAAQPMAPQQAGRRRLQRIGTPRTGAPVKRGQVQPHPPIGLCRFPPLRSAVPAHRDGRNEWPTLRAALSIRGHDCPPCRRSSP